MTTCKPRTADLLRHSSILLALIAGPAIAQEPRDTITLRPVVITATRSPLPAASLAGGVTVISGAALRAAGLATVAEALRGVPALQVVQAGSYGAQSSLFLRGGESDYTRLLIDGVPVNQAGGFVSLAFLSTEDVERIEIVRGPASVLYGSDAMTGVVQVLTRRGRGPARVRAQGWGGGHGTGEARAELTAGVGRASISLGALAATTDGILEYNNGADHFGLSGRLGWTPDGRTDVAVAVRHRTGTFHYPTDGTGALTDSNQFTRGRGTVVSVDAGRRLSDVLGLRLLLGAAQARDSVDDTPDGPGDTLGIYAYGSRTTTGRRSADLRADWSPASALALTAGVAVDEAYEKSANSFVGSFGSGGGTTDVSRTARSLYAQALLDAGAVTAQAGVRLDDARTYGSLVTWRAGASLRVTAGTRLRAQFGTAFKEPTFGEAFSTGYTVGNPALQPEQASSWELGLERGFAGERVVVALGWFDQLFTDMIQYTFRVTTPGDPNYYNVARASARGLEAELRAAPSAAFAVAAHYTWLRTEAQDSGFDGSVFAQGRPLLRRAEHSAAVSAEWRAATGLAGARVHHVGSREDLDFGTFPAARVTLPAYTRLDAWGEWRPLRGARPLALTFRVDNLTNASYSEVYGFAAPGRRLLAGVRIGATL